MARKIVDYAFSFVTNIEPERDDRGSVREFLPQSRYQNRRGLDLHNYGRGPFCRFRIPRNLSLGGVYVVAVGGEIVYVGECQNLSERFNARGYGTISPRNCFKGGQATNCRINTLILQSARRGQTIELWFHQTSERRKVEAAIIRNRQPAWNIQLR
jgi:hypothetical protein